MTRSVFGSAFERVVVINLDRRPDRMSSVRDQLDALGITYIRHPATDGKDPVVAAEWQTYARTSAVAADENRPVTNWHDFYLGDKPHRSRVAFFEADRKCKAISTPGAWGLFHSMRRVIEQALEDKVESLLILEDDVRFHRDTVDLWQKVISEVPQDWQILQLGAMQTNWADNWISWYSQHLYTCQGSSYAGHAIALRSDAMHAIVARSKEVDLPFDIGPIQEAKRVFKEHCFTAYPNIAIQDPADTEIGMSKIFEQEAKKTVNKYRWNWADYDPATLRPFPASEVGNRADKKSAERLAHTATHLQPYDAAPGSVERVLVVFGPEDAKSADAFISMLSAQKAGGEVAPIVLIDDLVHVPALREAELAFEYVPSPEVYRGALSADRDPVLVVERRLSIIRRKWLPRRIVALGPKAHARLETWRASPFEQAELGTDLASDEDFREAIE